MEPAGARVFSGRPLPGDWPRVRAAILERDHHRCTNCEADRPGELDIHHRIPRLQGGTDEPANLVTLCDGCHASLHLNLQVGLARRVIERWALRVARLVDVHKELPLSSIDFGPALRALGKDHLRDGQLPVVLAIMQGKDVLAVRPTGSGKSLCFQLPVIAQPGSALVFEPLKALMKDQVRALHERNIPATFISSDVPARERRERLDLMAKGTWKFVYLAPERFDATMIRDPTERDRLLSSRPRRVVIDEAHTIPTYGDGFRPAFREIRRIREELGNPQVVAFTATAGPGTQRRILEMIGSPDATVIVENPDRPNISLVRLAIPKAGGQRADIIASQLGRLQQGRAIIFVPTVREGTRVQELLRERGVRLDFYHAGAGDAGHRDQMQGRFQGSLEPAMNAIIATSAFGMGLDIPDVRLVVHWQPPFSVEDYLQGFGRAGRDGLPAHAILFTDPSDVGLLDYMVRDDADAAARRDAIRVLDRMANDRRQCFRRALVDHLLGTQRPRKSLAMRIVEWLYAAPAPRTVASACCDACSPDLVREILGMAPAS